MTVYSDALALLEVRCRSYGVGNIAAGPVCLGQAIELVADRPRERVALDRIRWFTGQAAPRYNDSHNDEEVRALLVNLDATYPSD